MDYLENRTYDEIEVGESASLSRILTNEDIQIFAIMSGDINPAHVDAEYAQSDMFRGIIGHGMWGGSLISTVLGTQLPGPGTIYLSQSLQFKKPVAIGDTLTATVTAKEKKPKNRILFSCLCTNQKKETVIEGEAEVIAPRKKIKRPKMVLPEIKLRRSYSLFNDYIAKAKTFKALRAAVIYPVHEKIILAVHDAEQAGFIKPVLIGPEDRIRQAAKKAKIDISAYQQIEVEHSFLAIEKAIQMARNEETDLIIRGAATREDLLPAIKDYKNGLLVDRVLSNITVMDVPTYPKALMLTDTLINVDPSIDEKRGIIQNAIDFARALGIEKPKVALIAGSDDITKEMQSTVDAAALCKMADRGQIKHAIIDGPLTFDNVISAEVARDKGISSPVIGDADIIVAPNLETGNILGKQLEYLAESRNASLVLGGKVPLLMSHINDIHLSTVSCALAILVVNMNR